MGRSTRNWLIAAIAVALIGGGIAATDRGEEMTGPPCTVTIGAEIVALTAEQARNATAIAAVASRLGSSNHAVTVAFATTLQESGLRNLDYGDLDSVGLFQQRPSQGWGTVEQIMRPSYSATQFFNRLELVRGWENMSVNDAAQLVQRSAFPEAYGKWENQARLMARSFTGEEPATFTCRATATSRSDAARALGAALRTDAGVPGVGETAREGRGWMMTSWLIARATDYGIDTVRFDGQRWQSGGVGWSAADTDEMVVRINV